MVDHHYAPGMDLYQSACTTEPQTKAARKKRPRWVKYVMSLLFITALLMVYINHRRKPDNSRSRWTSQQPRPKNVPEPQPRDSDFVAFFLEETRSPCFRWGETSLVKSGETIHKMVNCKPLDGQPLLIQGLASCLMCCIQASLPIVRMRTCEYASLDFCGL